MLDNVHAVATVAVKDLAVAKKFYEGALGLKLTSAEGDEALTYGSGSSQLIVYRSQFAGTNRATAMNWMLGKDITNTAQALKDRGVVFEHYELPGMTRRGDVHVAGDIQAAWFKDPDGNILCLMNG